MQGVPARVEKSEATIMEKLDQLGSVLANNMGGEGSGPNGGNRMSTNAGGGAEPLDDVDTGYDH